MSSNLYRQKYEKVAPQASTTGNSTYPKGGVPCSADTFVQAESSVLRLCHEVKGYVL